MFVYELSGCGFESRCSHLKNYFIKEINQNELISKKYNKVCRVLNYIENLLVLVTTVTGCVSIFVFASLVGVAIEITSSSIELKICAITARIKKV